MGEGVDSGTGEVITVAVGFSALFNAD